MKKVKNISFKKINTITHKSKKDLFVYDIMKTEIRVRKNLGQTKEDWFNYAHDYIHASQVLMSHIFSGEKCHHTSNTYKITKIKAGYLVIPTLYNLRHGIELFIKSLAKHCNIEVDKDHDIYKQYRQIELRLKKNPPFKYDKLAAKFKTSPEDIKKRSKWYINEFSVLVSKYYFQIPLTSSLKRKHLWIEDRNNEIFKYPEATGVHLFLKQGFLNITNVELKKVQIDIDKIHHSLLFFFFLIYPEKY